jgi:hypothetical protein
VIKEGLKVTYEGRETNKFVSSSVEQINVRGSLMRQSTPYAETLQSQKACAN